MKTRKPSGRTGPVWRMMLLAFLFSVFSPLSFAADGGSAAQNVNGIQMMQAFQKQDGGRDDGVTPVTDRKKKLIMFVMGIPLILLVLVTGAVGISMGIYGKPWFVAHMILAGLTMTLALVHAIVGVAWFYPF